MTTDLLARPTGEGRRARHDRDRSVLLAAAASNPWKDTDCIGPTVLAPGSLAKDCLPYDLHEPAASCLDGCGESGGGAVNEACDGVVLTVADENVRKAGFSR